jgi:hypothetical protein
MRRIALVLLIVLLPLQSIWAAAANACQHECGSAGKRLGHHLHQHVGTATDDSTADSADGAGVDGSTYHGHAAAALIGEELALATSCSRGYLPSPYRRHFADRFLEGPLRPPRVA